ncbi:MAG: hypothetical protein JSW26_16690 [Desulfobacterales bacterium]|nr:MAG: hypothetical protein JSW26_16690 [Desulfobacterales bacterium]
MYRAAVLVLLLLLSALTAGCGPKITPQEAKVLVVLEEIQRDVEDNNDYDRFVQLLTTAKAELDMLRQSDDPNPCFLSAAEKCYASYEIARKAWQKKMEATDEKRKADMEMTLAFSLSFSSLNIEKANNCYK